MNNEFSDSLRIGTRGSPLALFQAQWVKNKLETFNPNLRVEIHPIKTSGDSLPQTSIQPFTTKNIFIREIQDALVAEKIDIAVHSLKDMPSKPSNVFACEAFLSSGERFDILIHKGTFNRNDFDKPFVFATDSPRRVSQLKELFPNSVCEPVRGNVHTRIEKLNKHPHWDAVILSKAGIDRLNINPDHFHTFSPDELVPAGGQGIIAVECLSIKPGLRSIVKSINQPRAKQIYEIEMGFLSMLDAGCQTPIGIHLSEDNTVHVYAKKTKESPHVKFKHAFSPQNSVTQTLKQIHDMLNQQWKTLTGENFDRLFIS